jgi:positive regulator of sigma E activity
MTARGVVVGAAEDGFVDVELARIPRCAGCAGMCMWRRVDADRKTRVPVTSPCPRPGTPVLISLPGETVLRAALIVHGLPWAALLLGASCGASALHGDLGALLGAVAAVGAAVLVTPKLRRRVERHVLKGLTLTPLR